MTKGYVYCLTNKSMPGVCKVGYTCKDFNIRAKQFFTTAVPIPFDIEFSFYTEDAYQVEQRIHSALIENGFERFDKREFFKGSPDDIKKIFNIVISNYENEHTNTPTIKYQEPIIVVNNIPTYYVSGDYMAAKIVVNNMKDSIIYSSVDKHIYYKHNNVWNSLKKYTDFNSYVDNYKFIILRGNKKIVLTNEITTIEKISKAMVSIIKADLVEKNFQLLVRDTTKGKICFNNGVYDFKTKEFISWNIVKNVYTEIIMDRNYNSNVSKSKKEYIFNFFQEQFGKESFQDVLRITARAIAGHTEDKRWITLFGNRNSGKGLWEYMLRAAFGLQYIATTNSENFIFKKGKSLKNNNWIAYIKNARLVVINEIHPQTKLNGYLIKSFFNYNDMITGRELYCNPISFYHQCTLMICCNDIATVEPIDTNDNRIVIDMPYSYVSQSIIDEANEYQKHTLKLAIPNIKEILTRDSEYIDAFISIIFDYYEDSIPKIVALDEVGKIFAENTFNIKDIVLEHFIIDKNESVYMINRDIVKILGDIKRDFHIKESISTLKKILLSNGAATKKSGSIRGLKYIKIRD